MPDLQPPLEIDPKFAKVVDPASPPPMRIMAAKGIVPGATPKDVLAIQFALTFDPVEPVAAAAKKSLSEIPPTMLKGAIDAKTHPGLLDLIARERSGDEDLLEFLLLRKQVSDETLMHVAETSGSLKIVEIIGKNQERLLQNPKILDSVKKNPVTPKSLIDVTVAFLQMAGVLPTGIEARVAGLPEKVDAKLVDEILGDEDFGEDLTLDRGDGNDGELEEEKAKTLLQKLATMTVAHKVKLAYRANKEVRAVLVRDSNKVIVGAVLNSGRLTDGEVVALSKSRQVSSDVLRHIAKNRDWMKNYEVKVGLVSNPKTPQAIAMQELKMLRTGDLGSLSRNSNVPAIIKSMAKQMFDQKQTRR